MMTETNRYLIVNADDFGLSEGTNRGIIEAFENGILTSASLMTRHPAARQAAAYCQDHDHLSLGLHFDIGEWEYRAGDWVQLYGIAELDDIDQIQAELLSQLERFRDLVGRDPTHLDSHQHVHRDGTVHMVMLQVAQELGVPLRECSSHIHYDGRFYGQGSHGSAYPEGISVKGLLSILATLPAGITELGCHPGLDSQLSSLYRYERMREVHTLCDAQVKTAVERGGIELVSFCDLQAISLQLSSR